MVRRNLLTPIQPALILIGLVEAVLFASSVYVSGFLLYGTLAVCEDVVGPLTARALVISIVMMCSLVAVGLYQFHQRMTFSDVAARLLVAVAAGSVALAALFGIYPAIALPTQFGLVAISVAVPASLLTRYLFTRNVDENVFRRRILVYGCGERASTIGDLRRRADRRGFQVVACVPAPSDKVIAESGWHLVSDRPLLDISTDLNVDEIVIAMDDRRGHLPIEELLDCRLRGMQVIDLLEFHERESGKIRVDLVNPGWLIFSQGFRVTRLRELTKKAIDVGLSLFAMLLSLPIFFLVSLAIKFEDGAAASVIYRQERVGLRGRTFMLLKFRSMNEDAEVAGQAVWADIDDPRISRVGRLLRKYRLDELPQLINVLRGDMSWVGPRPERPQFVQELTDEISYYAERHTVRPGITGWAQLRYAYGSSKKDSMEKLQYDLYYIKNQSALLDLAILLQTFEVVIWGKGAR